MKPIPIFGSGVQSYSAVATAQRRLNCYYDPRSDGDKAQIVIRGTPGSSLWITLPVAPIRGWRVVLSTLYVVAGKNFYSITPLGVITPLGSLTTVTGKVELADNGLQIIVVDGTFGWTWTLATTTWAKITDSAFTSTATTVAFMDGWFIVEEAGTRKYQISAVYDGTTWTPTVFGTKENESSNILAVSVLNGNLVLWGAASIEFWQDVGSIPLPFQRINGTTASWGLSAVASRVPFMGTMAFLGQNPQGHIQVMALNGYEPLRISTSDIEHIINKFSVYSDAVALAYVVDGHSMYQITFPTGGRSFLYDGLTKMWQEVQTGLSEVGPHFANYGISFNLDNYVSDRTTGNIYKLTEEGYTDNGVPIKRQVRTRHVSMNGDLFSVSELFLDIETGVGLQAGQGSNPIMMIQVSKDGGRTFSTERQVSMGLVGQYRGPRLVTRRWGQARDFVWQFTVTDPVKFLITHGSAAISGASA